MTTDRILTDDSHLSMAEAADYLNMPLSSFKDWFNASIIVQNAFSFKNALHKKGRFTTPKRLREAHERLERIGQSAEIMKAFQIEKINLRRKAA